MLIVKVKNLDEENALLLSGIEKESEQPIMFGISPKKNKMYRYVLRAGEQQDFKIQENQILGLEQL